MDMDRVGISLLRNQYLTSQMLHNVNDEFVFRAKIDVSNAQLYFTFNAMVSIVESTASCQTFVARWHAR